jgi:hypothetical protein
VGRRRQATALAGDGEMWLHRSAEPSQHGVVLRHKMAPFTSAQRALRRLVSRSVFILVHLLAGLRPALLMYVFVLYSVYPAIDYTTDSTAARSGFDCRHWARNVAVFHRVASNGNWGCSRWGKEAWE